LFFLSRFPAGGPITQATRPPRPHPHPHPRPHPRPRHPRSPAHPRCIVSYSAVAKMHAKTRPRMGCGREGRLSRTRASHWLVGGDLWDCWGGGLAGGRAWSVGHPSRPCFPSITSMMLLLMVKMIKCDGGRQCWRRRRRRRERSASPLTLTFLLPSAIRMRAPSFGGTGGRAGGRRTRIRNAAPPRSLDVLKTYAYDSAAKSMMGGR
jgi:hypothetical protein